MSDDLDTFFHDFRQEIAAGAAASNNFSLTEFLAFYQRELSDAGQIEDLNFCFYENVPNGIRIDGYWMNDDAGIDLFIADYKNRSELETLSKTDIDAYLKRILKFYSQCLTGKLYEKLEEQSPPYGLAREMFENGRNFGRINLYLLSERRLSDQFKKLQINNSLGDTPVAFHIWDVTRLHRLRTSKGAKEPIAIDFNEVWGRSVQCLPAHLESANYRSYLLVMPGELVANLYARYSSQLLEQNVRSFLQARAAVNKGIRETILKNPEMFFAYNNGITATATAVKTEQNELGEFITHIDNLQIVNGGQTTASLFHTRRNDKVSLDKVFVQMKLSIVDPDLAETVVPKISEYANTQNRVNAADFFSNHAFHIQMEKFSRRIWVPATQGAQRETKWFYERARGQFLDAQSKMTAGEKKRFLAEFPKEQKFTKTDLAKFENVWDEHPKHVNLGADKNFATYAKRISIEWKTDANRFNEFYYRRIIARAIIFRATEQMVSAATWYNGGYRANIVAYTIALLNKCASTRKKVINFQTVWQNQEINSVLRDALSLLAHHVSQVITKPPEGISNISEWAKKDGCWTSLLGTLDQACELLSDAFYDELVDVEEMREEIKEAKKVQKFETSIEALTKVVELGGDYWKSLLTNPKALKLLTSKERDLLRIAAQIPKRVPADWQADTLLEIAGRF